MPPYTAPVARYNRISKLFREAPEEVWQHTGVITTDAVFSEENSAMHVTSGLLLCGAVGPLGGNWFWSCLDSSMAVQTMEAGELEIRISRTMASVDICLFTDGSIYERICDDRSDR